MPADQVKAIRRLLRHPGATVNDWEQGRREPDIAVRLLLRVIDAAPEVVEKTAKGQVVVPCCCPTRTTYPRISDWWK